MSTLKALLKDVPVEWKALGELAILKRGRVMSKNYLIENIGSYPVYSSQTANDGKIGEIKTFDFEGEFLTWTTDGANAGTIFYRQGKFSITNVCGLVEIKAPTSLSYKFLYYWLNIESKNHVYAGMGNPKLMSHQMEKIQIPIPYPNDPEKSLAVQQEVVWVLDSLSEQNKALTTALAQEIEQRKKQYEYYREELFRFEGKEVEWKTLGEIFEFKNGINKGKEFFGKGDKIINYTDVFRNSKIFEENILGKVETTESDIQRFNCRRGDVFFTRTSETKDEIGFASVLLSDIDICVFSGFLIRARPLTNLLFPEYCSYCFATDLIRKKIISSSNMTTRVTTTGSILAKIEIPIPSIQEQERIVHLLDQFDEATKNIVTQLEKEIKLRNKQYEYYRKLLLSFPRK